MINFENNEFFYEPFPHCVLNQFLEPSFYEELCKEFPGEDYMEKLETKKNNEERFNKFRLDSQVNVKKNSNNPIKFFLNKLRKKNLSFDFEFSSISVPNGFIVPHTDGRNKILGFVIPIIDNDKILKFNDLGTKILKAKNDKYKFNYENKMVPIEETEEIRILPFKKNMMSIHVKTFNSLHAVGPFKGNTPSPITRKSISMFLRQG